MFTHPLMVKTIREKKNQLETYSSKLISEAVIDEVCPLDRRQTND